MTVGIQGSTEDPRLMLSGFDQYAVRRSGATGRRCLRCGRPYVAGATACARRRSTTVQLGGERRPGWARAATRVRDHAGLQQLQTIEEASDLLGAAEVIRGWPPAFQIRTASSTCLARVGAVDDHQVAAGGQASISRRTIDRASS